MSSVAALAPEFWRRSPELPRQAPVQEAPEDAVTAFGAIDAFLDLSAPPATRFQKLAELNPAEQSLFMRHLSELIRFGVVGFETRDFEGQPRQSFVETTYADPSLRSAPPYRQRLRTPLDLRG